MPPQHRKGDARITQSKIVKSQNSPPKNKPLQFNSNKNEMKTASNSASHSPNTSFSSSAHNRLHDNNRKLHNKVTISILDDLARVPSITSVPKISEHPDTKMNLVSRLIQRYNDETGLYMFEAWERHLLSSILVMLVLFFIRSVYQILWWCFSNCSGMSYNPSVGSFLWNFVTSIAGDGQTSLPAASYTDYKGVEF
eukprot:Tbor_TRINITY_DN3663_c0_g1::TRINITY_DN3663_c0_g1_i1::g.406::m.406